jgi:hypothetical protein
MTKTRITALAAIAASLVSLAEAQLSPPLPSGISTFAAPTYASNVAQYQADLGDLYFDSNDTVPSSIQSWNIGPVNLASVYGSNPFLAAGGSVKVIFLGETAGWTNDFVYSSSAAPGVFTPLVTDIENNLMPPFGTIQSGQETQVSYAAGTTLDFWANSGGPIGEGGLFPAFSGANMYAGSDATVHTRWSTRNVTTTYFNGSSVVTAEILTLLVGFEDVRSTFTQYYDADYNDLVVAFQFLPSQTPVPEPSTYGLMGAAALIGVALLRRRMRKAS